MHKKKKNDFMIMRYINLCFKYLKEKTNSELYPFKKNNNVHLVLSTRLF